MKRELKQKPPEGAGGFSAGGSIQDIFLTKTRGLLTTGAEGMVIDSAG